MWNTLPTLPRQYLRIGLRQMVQSMVVAHVQHYLESVRVASPEDLARM